MFNALLGLLLLATLIGSRAAPDPGMKDDNGGLQEANASMVNLTRNPDAQSMKSASKNGTGKPNSTGSASKQTYGYFYYYTDEMWYVNPTSYVGTLGFICVAVVLHIIVCTMRQKPNGGGVSAAASCTSVSIQPDSPPPPYRLLYKSVPPPPDYETAARLQPRPPPNYTEINLQPPPTPPPPPPPPAPVHRPNFL